MLLATLPPLPLPPSSAGGTTNQSVTTVSGNIGLPDTFGAQMNLALVMVNSPQNPFIRSASDEFIDEYCDGDETLKRNLVSQDLGQSLAARGSFAMAVRSEFDNKLSEEGMLKPVALVKNYIDERLDGVPFDTMVNAGLVTASVASGYLSSVLKAAASLVKEGSGVPRFIPWSGLVLSICAIAVSWTNALGDAGTLISFTGGIIGLVCSLTNLTVDNISEDKIIAAITSIFSRYSVDNEFRVRFPYRKDTQ